MTALELLAKVKEQHPEAVEISVITHAAQYRKSVSPTADFTVLLYAGEIGMVDPYAHVAGDTPEEVLMKLRGPKRGE